MINTLIDIYILILIIDVIVSYLPQYKSHPLSVRVKQLSDLSCEPIRRVLPPNEIPFDISPIIVFFILKILSALFS